MKLELKNRTDKDIKNVCITATPYSLFLYLLYMGIDDINSTAFFIGQGMPKGICDRLPNSIDLSNYGDDNINKHKWTKYAQFFLLRYKLHTVFGFLKNADIYGADNIMLSSAVRGKQKMCVVEDGYSLYSPPISSKFSWYFRFLHKLFDISYNSFGRGHESNRILYTGALPLDIPNKKLILINPIHLWMSDKEKQKYIMEIYNISINDIACFKGKDVIVLTQPIEENGDIDEMEKIQMYRNAIQDIEKEKIIIKEHPRDVTNYTKCFPNIDCYKKPIPMEILSLIGIKFKKAITINSTSILNFSYDIERIILDKKCEDMLLRK